MSNNYEPPRTNARASPVTECRREGKNARPTVRVVKSSPREVAIRTQQRLQLDGRGHAYHPRGGTFILKKHHEA